MLEKFDLPTHIDRLDRADLLYLVVSRFCDLDLHPDAVSNPEMGYLYEELIRRFSELSNETAGEHFTPREAIRLMVNLLFIEDDQLLTKPGVVKTLLDPAAGTGGILSIAEDHLRSLNPQARLEVYGQELDPESYAIFRSDMVLKGQDASHIVLGNPFSEDGFAGQHFDCLLANPPFGVEGRARGPRRARVQGARRALRRRAAADQGGLVLFMQHMIAKMKPAEQSGISCLLAPTDTPGLTPGPRERTMGLRASPVGQVHLDGAKIPTDRLIGLEGRASHRHVNPRRGPAGNRGVCGRPEPSRIGRSPGIRRPRFAVAEHDESGEAGKDLHGCLPVVRAPDGARGRHGLPGSPPRRPRA